MMRFAGIPAENFPKKSSAKKPACLQGISGIPRAGLHCQFPASPFRENPRACPPENGGNFSSGIS